MKYSCLIIEVIRYVLDENSIPHKYLLQPIDKVLIYFDDKIPQNNSLRLRDREKWNEITTILENALRSAAKHAQNNGSISDEKAENFFKSGFLNIKIKKNCFKFLVAF